MLENAPVSLLFALVVKTQIQEAIYSTEWLQSFQILTTLTNMLLSLEFFSWTYASWTYAIVHFSFEAIC